MCAEEGAKHLKCLTEYFPNLSAHKKPTLTLIYLKVYFLSRFGYLMGLLQSGQFRVVSACHYKC